MCDRLLLEIFDLWRLFVIVWDYFKKEKSETETAVVAALCGGGLAGS